MPSTEPLTGTRNRRTLENIERAGFSISTLEHDRMRNAPPIVWPLIAGIAQASA